MIFKVKFKDIDPDTGLISQDKVLREFQDPELAEEYRNGLEEMWFSSEGGQDPNREFYVEEE